MIKKLLTLFLYCTFIFFTDFSFGQIYNNGSLITGTTAADGFICPSGYSWSEMQHNTTSTTQANSTSGLPAYYYNDGTISYSLADDFTIPAGQTWTISSFDFFCYEPIYGGSVPPINQLKIRLYNVNPSTPGATPILGNLTANVYDATNSDNAFVYRIFHATIPSPQQPNFSRKVFRIRGNLSATLPAGQYWVEFQTHATDNTEIFFPPVTVVGSRSVAGANSKVNVIASSSETLGWKNNMDTGIPASAPDVALAIPFLINGSVLGVNETTFESNITLYPNPVDAIFTIVNSSTTTIENVELFDVNSRLIKRVKCNNTSQINIDATDLSTGIYLVKIISDKSAVIKKIIKN
jgi:hypothetical protein